MIILVTLSIFISITFRSIGSSCRKDFLLSSILCVTCPMALSFCIFLIILGCWNGAALILTFCRWLTFLLSGSACPLLICLVIFESNLVNFNLSLFISYHPRFLKIFQSGRNVMNQKDLQYKNWHSLKRLEQVS